MNRSFHHVVLWSTGFALFCALSMARMDWELESGRSYAHSIDDFVALAFLAFYVALLAALGIGFAVVGACRTVSRRNRASVDRRTQGRTYVFSELPRSMDLIWILFGTGLSVVFGLGVAMVDAELNELPSLPTMQISDAAVRAWPALLLLCWCEWQTWRQCRDSRVYAWLWFGLLVVAMSQIGTVLLAEVPEGVFAERKVESAIGAGWFYLIARYSTFAALQIVRRPDI